MVESEQKFKNLLEILDREVGAASQAHFTLVTINNRLAQDRTIYGYLNRNPYFWNVVLHSLQCTFFITMGRIFDEDNDKNTFSLMKFLEFSKKNIGIFSLQCLKERKIKEVPGINIDEYIIGKNQLKIDDLTKLESNVEALSIAFRQRYKKIRNKVFGHTDIKFINNRKNVFSLTSLIETEIILNSLEMIVFGMRELFNNGRDYIFKNETTNDLANKLKIYRKRRFIEDTDAFIDSLM